jgi:hypothetical protein
MNNYTDYIEIVRVFTFDEDISSELAYTVPCLVRKSNIISVEPRTDDVNEKGTYVKTTSGDIILALETYADLKSALLYPSKKDQNAEKLYSEAFMACKKYNRSK